MALIYIYDASELDKRQLSAGLAATDHHWEYIADAISLGNCRPDTEVIVVFVTSTVTREIIEALPKLRLIACRSTGFDHIDLEAAKDHGVTVVNVPTYGEATVAEYAFALLLTLTRKLREVFALQLSPSQQDGLMGHDLNSKTIGVIGTGHIGRHALAIAKGFSMQLLAYDPYPKLELQNEYDFTYVELSELLRRSDVVTIHAPYTPASHHLIGRDQLGIMKPNALLINTARGELVDTAALVQWLDEGRLGGAAIDVVEGEVLLNYHEEAVLLRASELPDDMLRHSVEIAHLSKMPNVIISPHNAFNTVEAIERINQMTAQNIIDFWYGRTPNRVECAQKPFGKLLIVRHAESEWNVEGKWTGKTDTHLSDKGFKEAAAFGKALKKLCIPIDAAYCSGQIRSRETLEGMLGAAQLFNVESIGSDALNERDYGEYTGKNKWEMEQLLGADAFTRVRRGWNEPIPGGETLEMVYQRTVPFYLDTIVPQLREGMNVLIVAHGNSLRTIVKYIESISDEAIANFEMPFGEIRIYTIDEAGLRKSLIKIDAVFEPPHA